MDKTEVLEKIWEMIFDAKHLYEDYLKSLNVKTDSVLDSDDMSKAFFHLTEILWYERHNRSESELPITHIVFSDPF